jgi:hypothetical protein
MKVSQCRSCHAEIIWVTMAASGRRMPLDAVPTPDGTVAVDGNGLAVVLTGQHLERAKAATVHLFRSHFASCVNAKQHRKARTS